jgi:hypothetical protein
VDHTPDTRPREPFTTPTVDAALITRKYAAIVTALRPARVAAPRPAVSARIPSVRPGSARKAWTKPPAVPTTASATKTPDSHRRILWETSDHVKMPTRRGSSTPGAWNTARQLRLTIRTRRRYSVRMPPAVSS